MGKYSRDELERAFRHYWETGAVGEDWDGFADTFTEDCLYHEHILGTKRGREAVRAWIKPIMEQYCELYTAYEWHTVDEENDLVIVYMQNRRDHPSGQGTLDFPGVTILHYAGDMKWRCEEDFWALPAARVAQKAYDEALAQHDPEYRQKRTRLHWGNGPDWTRGAASWFERAKR